ncbi:hypothetical protein [Streptomyces sp. NPDC013187]|uniref:hypothetical protein n=1 Tax=Streptomyces sp. NPDC013187 TaxID=3364865 RepID=UPI0036BA4550
MPRPGPGARWGALRARSTLGSPPGPEHPGEPARLLVREQLVFQDEAEVRRPDHCEARLLRFTREEEAPSPEQPEA